MIKKFIRRFDAKRDELREHFRKHEPDSYMDIVKEVVKAIGNPDDYCSPDPERIHVIDDGDYQGTLVFVIGGTGYQPSTYWYVTWGYGSCSGCDTLQAIRDDGPYNREEPTKEQLDEYMMVALHILQGIKEMYGEGKDEEKDQEN
jgi:hypothetical protein